MNLTITMEHRALPIIRDTNLRVSDVGEWYQVCHDWQLEEFGWFPRQKYTTTPNRPFPATRYLPGMLKGQTSDFTPVLTSWQWRLYELFRHLVGPIPEDGEPEYYWIADPLHRGEQIKVPKGTKHSFPQYPVGSLRNAYMDFILDSRFLTDNHAFNTAMETDAECYRDDVLGLNLYGVRPWMMKSLIFTGQAVKRVDQSVLPTQMAIETFDYLKEAPSLDWIIASAPHLIWWTTEQGGMPQELPVLNGKRRWTVARTPQLKVVCQHYGLPEVGTPYFAIGKNGWNIINKSHVVRLENSAPYSNYVPEKF